MATDLVTFKMERNFLEKVDKTLKYFNYSSRTDFIRDAMRSKLAELDKAASIKKLEGFLGFSNKKTTDKENRKTREKVIKEHASNIGIKLD